MTGPIPPELAAACPDTRVAGPDDAVSGQLAAFVATPISTQKAAELLRAAATLNLSVVPRGSRTRLDWGMPPRSCDLIVDTSRLDAIIEHAAGDLVVRVQAGLRLDDLQAKLASAGQRLALDPPGGGTIGGILATNAAGPLRFRYGAPRDLLIGITVVRADGTAAKSGGKVVKNVAGYDLGKLFAGSYGTLGLITEATFRLHPLPATSTWVTLDCPNPTSAQRATEAIAASPLVPSAVELSWPSAAAPITIAALLEGDEASVDERAERMRALVAERRDGGIAGQPVIQGGPRPGGPAPILLRVACWPGQLTKVLGVIGRAAASSQLDPDVAGSAGAGVLEVTVEHDAPAASVADFVAAVRAGLAELSTGNGPPNMASAVVVNAPDAVRRALDMWGPVPSLGLMRAVKDQFDPGHKMAPGRFAGGI
jgi:glycolate oxidase FAD binding subunit